MKLLAIDGNSILNRAYYGIRPLTTSKGEPTNALYGFLNILLKHIEEEKPDKICVAFDLKSKTFRHDMYDGYKATRHGMPDELAAQLPEAKKLLDVMNIPRIEKEGLEADDIIGILSHTCTKNGDACIIVTGDRDSLQLVNDNVTVKLATTKQDIVYNEPEIKEKYGLTPQQLIDLKALMGDSSDNIPGVKGIGEKTAIKLLQEYGSLDGVYENADNIKGAIGEKIRNDKENAYLSKKLGTIVLEGDLSVDIAALSPQKPDNSALLEFLQEKEMNSFVKRLALTDEQNDKENVEEIPFLSIKSDYSDSLFKEEVLYIIYEDDYIYIKDENSIFKMAADQIDKLKSIKIVTHDAKPFISLCFNHGFRPNVIFDTMLAAYLLDASQNNYNYDRLCKEYINKSADDISKKVYCLKELYSALDKELKNNKQKELYEDIELPLCYVLADMENLGCQADKTFLEVFGEETEREIAELTEAIYSFAGKEFNINSPKQLGVILFEDLLLPVGRKTKTGYSTDNDVLEGLINSHPIIENIIRYRQMTKLKSTYVDGLLSKIDENGRIHTSFTQTVTQTGRISSVDPNLQNIPVRTALGRQLRHAFTAKDGCVLVDADYSQIELRILAHISDDPVMQNAFIENEDIHTITASEVFNLPPDMINPELRNRAKAVNFGIVYGIGDYSLSKDLGIYRKEAKAYIDGYLNTYKGVKAYMTDIIEFAKKNGYVETLFGRRRYVPEIHSKNKQIQAFASRISMNTPIQGTAADLIKIAMIKVYNVLKERNLKSKLILQVHDELIVEAPAEEAEEVSKILKTEMESAAKLSVPLIADVKIGDDWFDAH